VSHGQLNGSPWQYSRFSRPEPLLFLSSSSSYSRGWVDPVSDPLLLRKYGSVGNRTRNLWIYSQELWPLDHRDGRNEPTLSININIFWILPTKFYYRFRVIPRINNCYDQYIYIYRNPIIKTVMILCSVISPRAAVLTIFPPGPENTSNRLLLLVIWTTLALILLFPQRAEVLGLDLCCSGVSKPAGGSSTTARTHA
jgi:hypothetical protein